MSDWLFCSMQLDCAAAQAGLGAPRPATAVSACTHLSDISEDEVTHLPSDCSISKVSTVDSLSDHSLLAAPRKISADSLCLDSDSSDSESCLSVVAVNSERSAQQPHAQRSAPPSPLAACIEDDDSSASRSSRWTLRNGRWVYSPEPSSRKSGDDSDVSSARDSAPRLDQDAETLLHGVLATVRVGWRGGAHLRNRAVAIQKSECGYEVVICRATVEGLPSAFRHRGVRTSLRGAVVELVDVPGHPELYGWRVHLLPEISEETLSFACSTEVVRAMWLRACALALTPPTPVAGAAPRATLAIRIDSLSLCRHTPRLARWRSAQAPEAFVVGRLGSTTFRTAPCRLEAQDGEGFASPAAFGGVTVEVPMSDDDPDALVSFEVWLIKGSRCSRQGRVDVPLFRFDRGVETAVELPVRAVTDEACLGSIGVVGRLEQPLESLLLPRPAPAGPTPYEKAVLPTGLREIETLLEELDSFFKRCAWHYGALRDAQLAFRSVVEWDSPRATVAWLVTLTIAIVFLFSYILPLVVLACFLGSAARHPRVQVLRAGAAAHLERCRSRCCGAPRPVAGAAVEGAPPAHGVAAAAAGLGRAAKASVLDRCQQHLLRWCFIQERTEYWMSWYERRRNLLLGVTASTHQLVLVGLALFFVVAMLVPTRFLVIAWIYAYFYDGRSRSNLARQNRADFIAALKDAVVLWRPEGKCDEASWLPQTTLAAIAASDAQLAGLGVWIHSEFFAGKQVLTQAALARCATLMDLAVLVTSTSGCFPKTRTRRAVWWRSTLRNLLDHVPTDATLFQSMTYQGSSARAF